LPACRARTPAPAGSGRPGESQGYHEPSGSHGQARSQLQTAGASSFCKNVKLLHARDVGRSERVLQAQGLDLLQTLLDTSALACHRAQDAACEIPLQRLFIAAQDSLLLVLPFLKNERLGRTEQQRLAGEEGPAPSPRTRRSRCSRPRSACSRTEPPRRRRRESGTWACHSLRASDDVVRVGQKGRRPKRAPATRGCPQARFLDGPVPHPHCLTTNQPPS